MLVNQTLRSALATSIALALAVAAGPAWALGLGQIQVKSRPGQPLLAEIPIVSSDPTELQGLQVQLASPDTFRRIGLEPPTSVRCTSSPRSTSVAARSSASPVPRRCSSRC
jgi:pilus assembly protein FimV